ncbi:N6-adeinine specific methyltransferase [Fermentimonas caenicola]|uniref:N6-adeinine specific methyltransferase n=1 Tax=Fermentimonas caenicola TaxID=1562970 RepID=A0A098C0S4_9BACT|nr:N6-adeinine specific methyltransferase [Fermentimonas caenicola]
MQELNLKFKNEKIKSEPVVCLGKTFESEEARREYFREELRKKLPELKQIEGFPIGEDEDIIRLSDPPYYTACPNPWLNDFIAEWEKEKEELEKQGKRSSKFKVKVPYASDVSEGKNNPIYMAHAYHTKVPHPAIMRYILHYTQPGDIVFDGFAGTGMTGVAANMCGYPNKEIKIRFEKDANKKGEIVKWGKRNAICSDLSPIASFIASNYNSKNEISRIKEEVESIISKIYDEFSFLYKTKHNKIGLGEIVRTIWSDIFICNSCQNELVFWDNAVDEDNESVLNDFKCPNCGNIVNKRILEKAFETYYDPIQGMSMKIKKEVPVKIYYKYGGKTFSKIPDNYDFERIAEARKIVENYDSDYFGLIIPGEKTSEFFRNGYTHYNHLYYQRTIIILSEFAKRAKGNVGLFYLTSIILRATKLFRWSKNQAGPMMGTFYIASATFEINPFNLFKNKESLFDALKLTSKEWNIISTMSATNINLEDECVDYIFTDPPFGANIMYSELNSIWESWLKVFTNNSDEAIINKVQKKTLFDYQSLMNRSLREFYRILKPGKWITIEFSNTSALVWNSIQNALQSVGFVVANVAGLDKKQGSFNSVTTTTAVKQDLVITCFKPSKELLQKFESTQDKSENVWVFIEELLQKLPVHLVKDNFTTTVVERSPKILYDRLISYYVQHGYNVPLNAAEFQKGLRERFVERDGMFFTAEQAIEYEEKKANAPEMIPMALFVSSEAEGIEWLKRELEVTPKTYSELQPRWMQDLAKPKKGDELPELMQILEENFLKDEDGRWHKPDLENEADLEKIRSRKLLKEFNIYVDLASKPNAKIRTVRLEALRAGFKNAYTNKDFATIVNVGNRLPESLLMEDEVLLQYYDIASSRV